MNYFHQNQQSKKLFHFQNVCIFPGSDIWIISLLWVLCYKLISLTICVIISSVRYSRTKWSTVGLSPIRTNNPSISENNESISFTSLGWASSILLHVQSLSRLRATPRARAQPHAPWARTPRPPPQTRAPRPPRVRTPRPRFATGETTRSSSSSSSTPASGRDFVGSVSDRNGSSAGFTLSVVSISVSGS